VGDLPDDTEERTCFVALLRDRSEMPEIEVERLVGTGEISSALVVLVNVGRLMFAFRSSFTSPLGPAASGVSIRGVRSVSELGEFGVGVSILVGLC